jgi:YVTN family beta-propeller protein
MSTKLSKGFLSFLISTNISISLDSSCLFSSEYFFVSGGWLERNGCGERDLEKSYCKRLDIMIIYLYTYKGEHMPKRMHLINFLMIIILFLFSFSLIFGNYNVKKVDFLADLNLKVNGAGPLLVKTDIERNRIVLVNTNTSSISVINGKDYSVKNYPVKSRVPQYLKDEALTIDPSTGNIYIIGNKSLHIILPYTESSFTVDTKKQYEMVSVDRKNGNAFLVSRQSKDLAMVSLAKKELTTFKWLDKEEPMINLNATPPPPIRKVVVDHTLKRVIALDGYTSNLYLFSLTGKLLKKRTIVTKGGARWHFAGYNYDTHHLYVVIETDKRKVIDAAKIDIKKGNDVIVKLPELSEGVGINYNKKRDEVYIPYDNHPSVHIVDFREKGSVREVKIPAYGNDASAVDEERDILYVSSWAYGEVEVIDLKSGKLKKRIRDLGIIPHMFSMAFNPSDNKLYIPIGATAVNGSFGAALTQLDPEKEETRKIYTGWAPVDLIPLPAKDAMMVFNSEDSFAIVNPDGTFKTHTLPFDYPHQAVLYAGGNINLSYGPHQSYWPAVYIWGAKNGILGINPDSLDFYDRRIPRLAHQIVMDNKGVLYGLQNNWGGEKQFLFSFPDEVRSPNQGNLRIELDNKVIRETTQRILNYDNGKNWLYIVRTGETDSEPGIFQIYDLQKKKVILNFPLGLTPTDLAFNEKNIYICNFDSNSITVINKNDFTISKINTGEKPCKLAASEKNVYVINHNDNTLQVTGIQSNSLSIPFNGKPANIYLKGNSLFLTGHSADSFYIYAFFTREHRFLLLHQEKYPYGESTIDTNNSAFYMRGQFADSIFEINRIKEDAQGRIWITDYLSGSLFILSKK